MFLAVTVVTAFLACVFSYYWFKSNAIRKKLYWIPEIKGWPIAGNAVALSDPKVMLWAMKSYLDHNNGLCRIKLLKDHFVLVSDGPFLEHVLTTNTILHKSHEYKYLHKWLSSGLLTAGGAEWKRARKMLTPAFHFSILEMFVSVFETNGSVLIDILQKELGKPMFDVYPYIQMCTLDIICEAAMGVSIKAQKNPQSEYVFAVKEMLRILIERTFVPYKKFDSLFPLFSDYYKERKYLKTLHSYRDSVVDQRIREREKKMGAESNGTVDGVEGRKKKAFLDLLLDFTIDGNPLTRKEIGQEVDTFMFAGHDTTSSATSFALYCLANHPEIQDRVVEEQKVIFADDIHRPATYRDLQEMKFLEMAIKESLRLYPPVPFYGRGIHEDTEYKDGKIIPKDTRIIIFAFGANRNAKYFDNPDKYDPLRFEGTDSRPPFTYIPFSAGPRNCIGQKFAMLETKSIISKILRNYVLETAGPGSEPVLSAETVLVSDNGLNIRMKRREL